MSVVKGSFSFSDYCQRTPTTKTNYLKHTKPIRNTFPLIADTEVPYRFQTPNMKLYDGTIDPKDHVT